MNDLEINLLSIEQIFRDEKYIFDSYGYDISNTDLSILTGAYLYFGALARGWYWTQNIRGNEKIGCINNKGEMVPTSSFLRRGTIRPVLSSTELLTNGTLKRDTTITGVDIVEFGEYPQYAAPSSMQQILETEFSKGLKKTGNTYTFDDNKNPDYYYKFMPVTYDEYEYGGKKYIRIKAQAYKDCFELSNGIKYLNDNHVWVEVTPVKWLVDNKNGLLISTRGLASGIRYAGNGAPDLKYSTSEMKEYLDKYMLHDLTQNMVFIKADDMNKKRELTNIKTERNSYGLSFDNVSEEDIIKGAIESGVAVFLHGPSSEGKSARVKQIDPTCEIIYLRNASPESLNGKSVYNASTGEMIDVKPSWLKKLEAKCEQEPERLHVLFLDEITNALPSIQGIAFNIVLDREVNGIWKLPDNARIVAAGNDMKDSLAANQLAEPLFNRFAHVYIKTTTESWLKWASENNIHPAIYAYIAYKNGQTLRSEYNGEYPNADPRKWEMASKMLYKTQNPKMLRALVGEDITNEFVRFCNQRVITLDDVLNKNYDELEIASLNTAERYATTMGLSRVDEQNLENVRDFAGMLGNEFKAIFETLWTHGDEKRLEIIAEAKLAEAEVGDKSLWQKIKKNYYFHI